MEVVGAKMAKVSIIVPVYRVENYLDKCVTSLINQTLKDIEIILVDDGSPDNCGKICDEYAEKDGRVKIIHKQNEGLSEARNVGIMAAKSPYIGFVDSDDYVAEDMYEILYSNLIKNDAEVSICGLYDCYSNKKVSQFAGDEFLILDSKQALKTALEGVKFSVNAVNKLYKKELFSEVKFPKGKLSEDAFTIPQILSKASKVVFDSVPKYYYMHRGESITTSSFKRQDFNVVEAYKKNLEFVRNNFKDLIKQAEFRLLWSYTYVFDKMILSENFKDIESYKEILAILRKNTFKMVINPFFSLKRKLVMLILFVSPKLYANLLKFQKKKFMKLNY